MDLAGRLMCFFVFFFWRYVNCHKCRICFYYYVAGGSSKRTG